MAEAAIDKHEVRRGQMQGQSRRSGPAGGITQQSYQYREFDVPYDERNTLFADVELGTLFGGNITGTCTGVKDNGTTTVTATEPSFPEAVVGEDIVITDVDTFTIVSRTSTTIIVVTGDATCTSKAFTISGIPALTALYVAKRDLKVHRPRQPGRSTILAYYALPFWYRPDTTQNIRGKIYIDRKLTKEPLTGKLISIDLDGNVIEGPTGVEADDLKGISWVQEGRAAYSILLPRTKYRLLAAATTDWDPTTIGDLIGKVNAATALGSAAGKLLFLGTKEETTIVYSGENLRQVELQFLRNPTGWNNDIVVRRYERKAINYSVFSPNAPNTKLGEVGTLRWARLDAGTSTRKGYATGDFSVFDNMIDL